MDPVIARIMLDDASNVEEIGQRDKLVAFRMPSGRELALIEENAKKVSVYTEVYPKHMPDVVCEKTYPAVTTRQGRHSNLELITNNLGFSDRAHRLHLKTEESLERFLTWYQYA